MMILQLSDYLEDGECVANIHYEIKQMVAKKSLENLLLSTLASYSSTRYSDNKLIDYFVRILEQHSAAKAKLESLYTLT